MSTVFRILLLIGLLVCAVATALVKKPMRAVIIYMAYSIIMSVVWLLLESPDLAITEAAVGAGMTPLLAQLSAAGIVQIPGMMSGQILAGADPVIAAKYQIVVLLMISAATTLSVVIICFLAYKKRFSAEGYYLSPALRDDAGGAA